MSISGTLSIWLDSLGSDAGYFSTRRDRYVTKACPADELLGRRAGIFPRICLASVERRVEQFVGYLISSAFYFSRSKAAIVVMFPIVIRILASMRRIRVLFWIRGFHREEDEG